MKPQIFLSFLLFTLTSNLMAAPGGLTLQGRLVKDEVAVTGPVTLSVTITSPNSNQCYLYQETHSLTLTEGDSGIFSVHIGQGTRTTQDKGFSLVDVFSNTGTAISSLNCPGNVGTTTYTPLAGHSRYVYLSFNTSVGVVSFSDPYVVQSVPYALEAEKLAGKSASQYLQTTTDTTQVKLNDLMIPTNYTELLALLNGSSAQYMTTSNSAPTKLPVLTSSPSSPSAGQIWYEGGTLKYYDAVSSQVKSIGGFTGGSSPPTAGEHGITDVVLKGGQAGALTLGTSDSNALTVNTSNTARMTVLANGNVGIGTTAPSYILDTVSINTNTARFKSSADSTAGVLRVYNSSDKGIELVSYGSSYSAGSMLSVGPNGASLYSTASAPFGLATSSTQPLLFGTSNTERMRIASSGNVGIGIAAPAYSLDVVGSTRSTLFLASGGSSSATARPFYNIRPNGNDRFMLGTLGTESGSNVGSDFGIWSYNDTNTLVSTPSFLIQRSSGNVGIGTTSPAYKLDVTGEVNIPVNSYLRVGSAGILTNTGTSTNLRAQSGAGINLMLDSTSGISILSSGNVGIGTTTPNAKLEIASANTGTTLNGAENFAIIRNTNSGTAGALSGIGFVVNNSAAIGAKILASNHNSNGAASLLITTRDTSGTEAERMRITSTGNVGIGTTSPNSKLSLFGGGFQATFDNSAIVQRDVFQGRINSSSSTGTIVLTMPSTWDTNMSNITIKGYDYSGSTGAWSVVIGGYSYVAGSQWINSSAQIYGRPPFSSVRLGHNGTTTVILLGDVNTVAKYLSVAVSEIISERGTVIPSTGWALAQTTDESPYTISATPSITSWVTNGANSSYLAGNVGIGTASPSYPLHVVTAGTVGAYVTNGTQWVSMADTTAGVYGLKTNGHISTLSNIYVGNSGTVHSNSGSLNLAPAQTVVMTLLAGGNVGIGKTNPSYALDVVGDTYTSGYFRSPNGTIQTSDKRFKKNIEPIQNSLEKILSLRGVTYDWKREEFPAQKFTDKHQMGVIAQEVEASFPEAVITDKSGYKAVNYSALIAPLINAVKELYATLGRIDAKTEAKMKSLEEENIVMKARIEKLEKVLEGQ